MNEVDPKEQDAGTSEGSKKPKLDGKLVKHVARALAGIERDQWVALDKAVQRPHITKARRVLQAIERYSNPARGGRASAAQDDL